MGKAIEAVNLQVAYRSGAQAEEILALDGINLHVPANQFICIVGQSGCGKTTFLNTLDGSVQPSAGSISIEGKSVRGPGPDRAMVFQQASLFPWHTTVRNVAYGLELQDVDRQEAEQRAKSLLKVVGLAGYETYYPSQLSGGMQQRANLSRALAVDPEILLLDEPFAALDAQTQEFMQGELTRVWQQFQKTAVFITHDIGEAVFLADRVIVFSPRPGRVKADIRIDLPRPRTLEVKRTVPFLKLEDEIWSQLGVQETLRNQSVRERAETIVTSCTPAHHANEEATLDRSGEIAAGDAAQLRKRPARARLGMDGLRRFALGLSSIALVLLAWELSARLAFINVSFSSSPAEIAQSAVRPFQDPSFWVDLGSSGLVLLIGFGIAVAGGITIGILVGWYDNLAAFLAPFVSGLYATPRIALAPLLIIWFGIGLGSKVALVVVSAIFPILINTAAGIRATDRHLVRIARSFGANDWELFRTVAIPGSVPYIISGLRLGAGLGIIGVVVAELIAGTSGVGHRMLLAGQTFQMGDMFVCLLTFTCAGMLLSQIFARLEARFDAWRRKT